MMTNTQTTTWRSTWKKRLGPYERSDNRAALFQLTTTLALFGLVWWLTLEGLALGWWATLLGAPFSAWLYVRLFIFQHDCGHGSFFTSRRANDLVGFWLGVLTLTPYHYWKRSHAIHHGSSGNLDRRTIGDVTTLTVAEYLEMPWWRRIAYRLYRNPLVMFGLGPVWVFLLKHRLPLGTPRSWTREWRSVMLTNAALAGVVAVMAWAVGLDRFLVVQLPINLVAGPIGIWLFYVQHQFEGTYWERGDDWDFVDAGLQGASFYDLPPVLHWMTGNIGFHHIHHLSSRIPNYRLRACYREVDELQEGPRLGLLESLGCLRLRLWDEAEGRLVGFRHLRAGVRQAAP